MKAVLPVKRKDIEACGGLGDAQFYEQVFGSEGMLVGVIVFFGQKRARNGQKDHYFNKKRQFLAINSQKCNVASIFIFRSDEQPMAHHKTKVMVRFEWG